MSLKAKVFLTILLVLFFFVFIISQSTGTLLYISLFFSFFIVLMAYSIYMQTKQNIASLLKNTQTLNHQIQQREEAQNTHSIVGVTDIKGTLTYVNKKFIEISGFSEEELIGDNHRIINSSEYDTYFWTNMYNKISKGQVWFHPAVKNKNKNGDFYWVDTTIYPLMDANGKLESYISIRTDVTQSVLANKALIKANKEAKIAVIAKAEFLASMSHEIRTPMNGVIGMLNLLLNTELSKQQHEHVQLAESSATSLLNVINDILDFSKLEAVKVDLENIDFNITNELSNFSKNIAVNIKNQEVELLLDTLDVPSSHIVTDLGRLKQILSNIVGNAIKFTHKGHIRIKASIHEKDNIPYLFVDVSDTGIGITKEQTETLFDSFTQADSSTTRKYGGTGLGLSIVKQIISLMGGNIDVQSTLGEGTTFRFTLPVAYGKVVEDFMPVANMQKQKVLIVDDNPTSLEILENQLKQWHINVTSTTSALEALEACKNKSFDIMIADMDMPFMDGKDLGIEIQKIPSAKAMRTILMTSYGQYNDLKSLEEIGFDTFFAKPITQGDLFHAIKVVQESTNKDDRVLTQEKRGTSKSLANNWSKDTKILLIEDNTVNQIVAQGQLGHIGLEADIAVDGQKALDILRTSEETYTLLLMDCQMPVLDGFDTTRQIRAGKAGKKYKDVTIIAMTANVMEGDKELCLLVGMDDYIPKPIDPDLLNASLLKYLKQDATSTKDTWNTNVALARVMNKKNIFIKVLNAFLIEIAKNMKDLELAIQEQNFEIIQRIAHTIKGSSANIDATNLSKLSVEIETLAKEKKMEYMNDKFYQIKSEVTQVKGLLQNYIQEEAPY